MPTSSKLRALAAAALVFVLGFVSGCATAASTGDDGRLVQRILSAILPPDFSGPVSFRRSDMLMDWDIQAGGVRRNTETGLWTWDWLTYERKSHFAIVSGLSWNSTGVVRLGSPTMPVAP